MKNNLFKNFEFNIKKIRNERLNENKNENEYSSTSSEVEDKKSDNENEEKIIERNKTPIVFNRKDEQNSSNHKEERIPINYNKNNSDDYNDNFDINDNTKKSILKNHPTYYIPFKKIFKEDIKEIDIDELKYNDYKRNNKKDEKFIIPVKQIRKRDEENKKVPNEEKNNINMNYINPGFPGVNKNENYSHIMNVQNNFNNIMNYFKIEEEEQKYFQLLHIGLKSLLNNENVNSYLLNNMIINNNINIYDNINNYAQFYFLNNNINYFGNYTYDSYLPNNNMINFPQAQNNINITRNINNPEEYTITRKSKTNDPSIEKIEKIEVTTSFIKNSTKVSQEMNDNSKNENIINLNDIINGKEKRTVVRLHPIPPNYSSFDICKFLDYYLKIKSGKNQRIYKALYSPKCKVIEKNLGYCFVMMVKPKYVIDFYNAFNGKIFWKKLCKRPCKVTWAGIQGEELLNLTGDNPFTKPIIFKDIINEEGDKPNNYFNFN